MCSSDLTVPLQIKTGLVALFAAIPGVASAWLNRQHPIDENETDEGVVINLRQGPIESSADSQITLPMTMQFRVSIYVSVVVGGPSVDELVDPIWQAVNTIMHGTARSLAGVQGVTFLGSLPEADGDAGRLDLVYNVILRTYQLDLTAPAA